MPFTKLEEDLLRRLLTQNIDLHGRRIINAGNSVDEKDYITREELELLKDRVAKLEGEN